MIQLHRDPVICLYPEFVTPHECQQLITLATPRLHPVTVVNGTTGANEVNPHRTGRMAWLHAPDADGLIDALRVRIADTLQIALDRHEAVHVVAYGPGEEYRGHYDWFDPDIPGMGAHLANGGQRSDTAILYLQCAEAGGETIFPRLNLQVTPTLGALLHFHNLEADGSISRRMFHAGLPPTCGTKIIATAWIRQCSRHPQASTLLV